MHITQKPFGVLEVVRYAFSALVKNWKAFLITDLLISGFIYVGSLIASGFGVQTPFIVHQLLERGGAMGVLGSIALSLVSILVSIVMFILFVWFYAAYAKLSLNTYDGQVFDIKNIISSYRSIPSVAVVFFVKQFFIFALGIIAFAILSIWGLNFFWIALALTLLALLAIWFYVKTSFSTFFIVDRGCGATESLRLSYRLTQDRFWLVVGVNIVVGLCALLLMLLLGLCTALLVGALFGMESDLTILIIRIVGIPFYALIMCGSWCLAQAYMYRKFAEHYALRRTDKSLNAK